MYTVGKGLNTLDDNNLDQISALIQHCQGMQAVNETAGVSSCNDIMDYIETVTGEVFEYNAMKFGYDWEPVEDAVIGFLSNSTQKEAIYKAIHVENSTKKEVFQFSSEEAAFGYESDGLVDYTWYYSYLIDMDHPVIVAGGEYDMKDGSLS